MHVSLCWRSPCVASAASPHAHAEVPQLPCAAGATPGCNTQHPVSTAPTTATQCRDWYSEVSQPGKKKGVWVGWRKVSRGVEACTVTFSWYQKLGMWKKHPSKRHSGCQRPEAAQLSSTVPVAEPGACSQSLRQKHKPQAGVSLHEIPRHKISARNISTAAMYQITPLFSAV